MGSNNRSLTHVRFHGVVFETRLMRGLVSALTGMKRVMASPGEAGGSKGVDPFRA